MAQPTWFLPPHFSFLPDEELALGTVIAHPSKPTRVLATLTPENHPDIVLPEVVTRFETRHHHETGSERQFSGSLFARVVDLASVSGSSSISRSKITSLSTVDLELRKFKHGLSPDSLRKIVALDTVNEHVTRSILGNRAFYIITGLRVAKESFEVRFEDKLSMSASVGLSGPAPTQGLPGEIALEANASRARSQVDGYNTAPGSVYAFQVYVVRAKKDGSAAAELFAHKTGFMTGEDEDDEDEEPKEMECVEVIPAVLQDDKELVVKFEEFSVGEETCILFEEET